MRNEIRFIDKHFISSRMIEPVMAYLDVFDTSVINILILSGYLALLGEVIALSYFFSIPQYTNLSIVMPYSRFLSLHSTQSAQPFLKSW